jgi:hypothetical protein
MSESHIEIIGMLPDQITDKGTACFNWPTSAHIIIDSMVTDLTTFFFLQAVCH